MEVDGRPKIGGMEKAFTANVMMRLVEFFVWGVMWDVSPTTKRQRKRKKTSRRSGNEDWGLWDNLPNELLVSVLMRLSVIDYISFSGVCRWWRSTSINIKKYFMEHQQPLVVARTKYSKKSCLLYNMFDGESWKTMLSDLPRKNIVGLSCGYLITIDRSKGFWLVNLMTRHELHFPILPQSVCGILDHEIRAVLFRSIQLTKVFMVLFCRNHSFIMLSENGASSWQEYHLPNTSAGISDVKVFDGRIFVLTSDALLGEFNPRAVPVLKFCNVNIPIKVSSFMWLQLVASETMLYMIVSLNLNSLTSWIKYLSVYELNQKTESVKRIHDLGSKSVFLSRNNSAVVDTIGWGAGNCVCVFQSMCLNRCSFFHLNGNKLADVPVVWDGYSKPYFWYFPVEGWDISSVGDEFGL